MPTRRQLAAHLGAIVGGSLAFACSRQTVAAVPLYVGCRRTSGGAFRFSGFDGDGRTRFDVALPGRGHDVAFHPTRMQGVLFARRPGTFAVVVDLERGTVKQRFDASAGRHFYGHGVFSPTAGVLISAENEFASGEGRLGIRDPSDGFHQIGELPSHGIGPHDVHLLPDGKTLVVANGGIRTHPDRGRDKLNIDDMRPNLAVVELASGRLVDRYELPAELHKLSIRHLDVAPDGRVAVGMQYEGAKSDAVPLVAVFDGERIRPLPASADRSRAMWHYVGSIAFAEDTRTICATAPRADMATLWDAESGDHIRSLTLPDAGGVAPHGCGFVVAGAEIATMSGPARGERCVPILPVALTAWDNHLSRQKGSRLFGTPSGVQLR